MVGKISKIILWVLMGIGLIIIFAFGIEMGLGHITGLDDEPDFTYPIWCTDALLIWTFAITIIAGLLFGLSLIYDLIVTRFHLNFWIAIFVSIFMCIPGCIYGFMCKDDTMMINNKMVSDIGFDIIITDTCMIAIIILFVATILATIFSLIKGVISK